MSRVLFIGGTGIISSACSPLAIERGHELFLFNRGESFREPPEGATVIRGDIRQDPEALRRAVEEQAIDVVVNWIAFTPEDVRRDIEMLEGRLQQYIFISSASAYAKPVASLPIREETPLGNPYWQYSRNKEACETLLLEAHQQSGFPATIVRPSHTYDASLLPFRGGYTILKRILDGRPVVLHGDGTSLWVLTHHRDFARGFVGLLGLEAAVGEAYQITSDEVLTWKAIYAALVEAAGAEPNAVYVPSELIARYDADWGASLLGDKAHSVIFDNSKIKSAVPDYQAKIPFEQGAREIVAFYAAHPERQQVDADFDALQDRIVGDLQSLPRQLKSSL